MRVLALAFLTAFGTSLALVPLCRRLATYYGYVAQPKADRWHQRPTALMGGVAMAVALFFGLGVTGVYTELRVLSAAVAGICLLGLVDDLFTLRPSTKLVAQLALASLFLIFRYRLGWVESLTLDSLLTMLWIVGITNAFNLLDNMDGLCAGIATIAGITLLISLQPASYGSLANAEARYVAALIGATSGFLVYNIHPATIFMGDSGSLLIGLSFAGLTLSSPGQTLSRGDLLPIVAVPVLVLLIPIFDTTLVSLSRIVSGRRTSVGGRDHSSHRLVAMGLSERGAVLTLWLLAAVGGTIAVVVRGSESGWSALLAAMFFLFTSLFAVYLGRIRVYDEADTKMLREGKVTPLVADFVYKRRIAEVLLDFCLISIAYYAAYRLRFEGDEYAIQSRLLIRSLPVVLAVQLVSFFAVGAYRGVWRHFSMSDATVIGKGVAAGAVCAQLAALYLDRSITYSRTVFAIYGVLVFVMVVASRASFRLIGEYLVRQREGGRRVVIYGAGDGGTLAVRELANLFPTGCKILGFVDDDARKMRMRVHGYPVLGSYDALVSLVSNEVVDQVVVSARQIDPARARELERLCGQYGVALSKLHVTLEELLPPLDLDRRPSGQRAG